MRPMNSYFSTFASVLPSRKVGGRLCAIAAAVAIATLSGCETAPTAVKPPPPPPVAPIPAGPTPVPTHPLSGDQPNFLKLGNMQGGQTPVRVGVLLPFSNGSAGTRALSASMMKAAELALFDAGNSNIVLISADEGSTPEAAAAGAHSLLAQGAEIIIGPLFSQSATAIAPIARDRAVPVISFSTDRSVAGDGIYLLSFQPEIAVQRVVSYAAAHGHSAFAALVPETAYGHIVGKAFADEVKDVGAKVTDIEKFSPSSAAISEPVHAVAQTNPDAILIAQGGPLLKEIAPALASAGAPNSRVKYLGTGLWDDPSIAREPMLAGGWFAAPSPEGERAFDAKYRASFGQTPPQLATLSYDAVSLIALLASGTPYKRFTPAALADPNGFSGVDGIFRFNPDGTSDRGLAILSVEQDGSFHMIDPAPTTFQQPKGS
jgi:branched-chain amino acid transport system substrate-binding protein